MHLNFQLTSDKHLIRVRVPVTLALAPELQEPTGQSPEISLTLKGKPGVDFVHGSVQVSVKVGLHNRQADGTYLVKVTPKNIRINDRKFSLHTIDFPEDGNLRLNLLSRGERHVRIEPVFDGTVPSGKKLRWQTVPDKVLITGAENVLSELEKLHTTPIPLNDAQEFFEFNAPLHLPDGVAAAPKTVLVRVNMFSLHSKRSMRLPVSILLPHQGNMSASLVHPPRGGAELVLKGPAPKLAALAHEQVRIYVDAVDLKTPGKQRLPLQCNVNIPGMEVVSIVPEEVEIQLKTKTSK
jgi:YbbR domain-containing protein